jgi:hypothetical protein
MGIGGASPTLHVAFPLRPSATSAVDNLLLVVRGIGVRCTPYATPRICFRVRALLRAWPLMSLLK